MKSYSIVGMNYQKSEQFIELLPPGTPVTLVREPTNQYDANAIAVWIDGRKVGFIPKKQNGVLSQFIDQAGKPLKDIDLQERSAIIAMDAADKELPDVMSKSVSAKFIRSSNSRYPMVEVDG